MISPTASASLQRLLIVYPLLPEPQAIIQSVRDAFPGASIGFYTANAEAAKRAMACGVEASCFAPLSRRSPFVPKDIRNAGYEAVVTFVEPAQGRHYLMFLIQTLTWFGIRRYVFRDSRIRPFKSALVLILGLLMRYLLPVLTLSVALHLWWALLLVPGLLVGLLTGRNLQDVHKILSSTGFFFRTPLSYLSLNPMQPGPPFVTVWRVWFDFVRGPSSPSGAGKGEVLMIRLDHLGDVVMTTSALSALKACGEPWKITMIVGPWGESVFSHDPRIDHLVVYPSDDMMIRRGFLPSGSRQNRKKIVRNLKGHTFEAVIDPSVSVDSTMLSYLPRARRRVTMHLNRWFAHGLIQTVDYHPGEPDLGRLARILDAVGLPAALEAPSLRLGERSVMEASEHLRRADLAEEPFLCIHPGANWPGRMWPIARFVDLAERAWERYHLRAVAVFGPSEDLLMKRFLDGTRDIRGVAFKDLPLPTVFAIIAKASLFVGNDSGLMHASSALNRPTLGIFGPGDVKRWKPLGAFSRVVTLNLACSPCHQSYCTDPRCLLELDVESVWHALADLMDQLNRKEASARVSP